MAELVAASENPGPVKLPAWDDVLHIVPSKKPNAREQQQSIDYLIAEARQVEPPESVERVARVRARSATAPPSSGIGWLDTLAFKIYKADQVEGSIIPAWRQKMIRVIGAIDNVEDVVSTVEWMTRGIRAAIPGGAAIGRVLKGSSSAMDRVNQVLAGPSIIGRRQKSKSEQERRANARTRKTKPKGAQRAMQWVADNFGHLLEAGQAADTVVGVGIQLGGIMGAIEETQDRAWLSAWHGAQAVVGLAVASLPGIPEELAAVLREQADEQINEVRRTGLPLIEQIGALAARVGVAARRLTPLGAIEGAQELVNSIRTEGIGAYLARAARGAATLQTDNELYSRGDHAAALIVSAHAGTALAIVLDLVQHLTPERSFGEFTMPAPRVTDPVSRALLQARGVEFDRLGQGLYDWAQPTQSVREWMAEGIAAASEARATWLPQGMREDRDQVLHALTEAQLPTTALLLTGAVDGIATVYEPAVRAELMLYHTGVYPPREISEARLRAWMNAQIAAAEAEPDDYDERTWRAITARYW